MDHKLSLAHQELAKSSTSQYDSNGESQNGMTMFEVYKTAREAAESIVTRQNLLRLQGMEMHSASIVKQGGGYLMTIEGRHSEALTHFLRD